MPSNRDSSNFVLDLMQMERRDAGILQIHFTYFSVFIWSISSEWTKLKNKQKEITSGKKKTNRAFHQNRISLDFSCFAHIQRIHRICQQFGLIAAHPKFDQSLLLRYGIFVSHFIDSVPLHWWRMDKLLSDWWWTIWTWHNEHTSN